VGLEGAPAGPGRGGTRGQAASLATLTHPRGTGARTQPHSTPKFLHPHLQTCSFALKRESPSGQIGAGASPSGLKATGVVFLVKEMGQNIAAEKAVPEEISSEGASHVATLCPAPTPDAR